MLSFDHGEVHNLSVEVLKTLSTTEASAGDAALACFLSAGRVLAGKKLTEEEELRFLHASIEWVGAYFADGEDN